MSRSNRELYNIVEINQTIIDNIKSSKVRSDKEVDRLMNIMREEAELPSNRFMDWAHRLESYINAVINSKVIDVQIMNRYGKFVKELMSYNRDLAQGEGDVEELRNTVTKLVKYIKTLESKKRLPITVINKPFVPPEIPEEVFEEEPESEDDDYDEESYDEDGLLEEEQDEDVNEVEVRGYSEITDEYDTSDEVPVPEHHIEKPLPVKAYFKPKDRYKQYRKEAKILIERLNNNRKGTSKDLSKIEPEFLATIKDYNSRMKDLDKLKILWGLRGILKLGYDKVYATSKNLCYVLGGTDVIIYHTLKQLSQYGFVKKNILPVPDGRYNTVFYTITEDGYKYLYMTRNEEESS